MHCSLNLLGEASWSYWAVELGFSAAFTECTIIMTKFAHHSVVQFLKNSSNLNRKVGILFLKKVYASYFSKKENGTLTYNWAKWMKENAACVYHNQNPVFSVKYKTLLHLW